MAENNQPGTRPVTAAELMGRRPGHVDVFCEAWQSWVRLRRLSGPAKFRMALAAEALGGAEDKERNYQFGVDLLAESIVDSEGQLQFAADDAAREWLSGEIEATAQLVPAALELNGIAPAIVAAEVEAAEKNSGEVQVVVSSTDLDLLLDGQSPSYAETMQPAAVPLER